MATPLLTDLRARFAKAKITVMCKKPLAPLFFSNPAVDELFTFETPNSFFRRLSQRHLIERIRQGRYDLGILLTNSFSSAWWFSRGRIKRRLGFAADGRSLLLTDPIPFPACRGKEHLVKTYKRILAPLEIEISQTDPELFVLEQERSAIEQLLKQYQIPKKALLIGINPTAAYGPAKCWPKERFLALSKRLLAKDQNIYILFFGDKSGQKLCASIANQLPERAVNLAGRTSLRELIALIQRCNLFLTNDSGPMHIAAALKTPLIALFGSTSDVATGPYQHGQVLHKHVECSPCYKRVCPIDFRCMKQILVEEVYNEIIKNI